MKPGIVSRSKSEFEWRLSTTTSKFESVVDQSGAKIKQWCQEIMGRPLPGFLRLSRMLETTLVCCPTDLPGDSD